MHAAVAPGRVNLIGDHTDYQNGWCLPLAIDRAVTVEYAPRADGRVEATSRDFAGRVALAADGSVDPETVEPAWGRTIAAILRVLGERGRAPRGCDLAVSSDVPVGAGLSSSAAFEVAGALACAAVAEMSITTRDLALAAQEVEHVATGVPCGVMDQMASTYGRAGHALLLDCCSLAVEPVALPHGVAVLVVHSGVPRRLVDSAYAERRAACEAAAARLGVPALRDATIEQVADDPFARHVVSENTRVLAFVDALRRDDLVECGRLMLASHASLRDDFSVSTPELDALVDRLTEEGAFGARLTGAGFGGCVVSLIEESAAPAVAARTGGWVLHAAGGAHIEERED